MQFAIRFGLTILLTIAFEAIYSRAVSKSRRERDQDTMEESVHDGCQTSMRMCVFGVVSVVIVLAVSSAFGR